MAPLQLLLLLLPTLCAAWVIAPAIGARARIAAPRIAAPRIAAPRMMAANWEDLTVLELKAACREKGLKVSGRKAELIERVVAADPGMADGAVTTAARGRGRGRGRGPGRGPGRGRGQAGASQTAAAAAPSDDRAVIDSPVEVLQEPDGARPFAAPSSASVVAEVVTEEEDDADRRAKRRAARRSKLAQYYSEEVGNVISKLEIRAGNAYAATFGVTDEPAAGNSASVGAPAPAPPPAAATSAVAADGATYNGSNGRRLAWCRAFDPASGRGVLVDLEERSEWTVNREALRVHSRREDATLHPGEFVEYEPAAAVMLANGGEPPRPWVRGILGWPLMCEAIEGEVEGAGAAGSSG